MSKYTLDELNSGMILVGDTAKNGMPWWYNQVIQDKNTADGLPSPIYDGAIPVSDIEHRLFPWEAVPRRVAVEVPASVDQIVNSPETVHYVNGDAMTWEIQEEKRAWVSNDTHEVLGIHSDDYRGHNYTEWLLNGPAAILDEKLHISGAGLLDDRAVAYVNISTGETMRNDKGAGMDFLPFLLCTTSFNGKIATTYGFHSTIVVCDNTFAGAMRRIESNEAGGNNSRGGVVRYRHTSGSLNRIMEAREALGIIVKGGEDLMAELDALSRVKVAPIEWSKTLDIMIPTKGEAGKEFSKAALTKATNKRDVLNSLYRNDLRVSPWSGTALGVIQAFNTYDHHMRPVRKGTNRIERNMLDTVQGKMAKNDQMVFDALNKAMNGALETLVSVPA